MPTGAWIAQCEALNQSPLQHASMSFHLLNLSVNHGPSRFMFVSSSASGLCIQCLQLQTIQISQGFILVVQHLIDRASQTAFLFISWITSGSPHEMRALKAIFGPTFDITLVDQLIFDSINSTSFSFFQALSWLFSTSATSRSPKSRENNALFEGVAIGSLRNERAKCDPLSDF